jgi:hypothetical protein
MNPETMKAISVQGHHVLAPRRAVIHGDNKILHPVGRDVADDYLVDPADVAQHGADLKRPIRAFFSSDDSGIKNERKYSQYGDGRLRIFFCSPFCAYSNFSEPRTKADDLWPANYF